MTNKTNMFLKTRTLQHFLFRKIIYLDFSVSALTLLCRVHGAVWMHIFTIKFATATAAAAAAIFHPEKFGLENCHCTVATHTNCVRLNFAFVFVRICGWVRFSNYSSRSLLLLNFYLFQFFFYFAMCIADRCAVLRLLLFGVEESNVGECERERVCATLYECLEYGHCFFFSLFSWLSFYSSAAGVCDWVRVCLCLSSWLCTFFERITVEVI